MNWYLEALKNYADFSGRARRKEYWLFTLFNILINIVLTFVDLQLNTVSQGGFGILSSHLQPLRFDPLLRRPVPQTPRH